MYILTDFARSYDDATAGCNIKKSFDVALSPASSGSGSCLFISLSLPLHFHNFKAVDSHQGRILCWWRGYDCGSSGLAVIKPKCCFQMVCTAVRNMALTREKKKLVADWGNRKFGIQCARRPIQRAKM